MTMPAWKVSPELIVERLRALVDSREAVRIRVPAMSEAWMVKRGYLIPAAVRLRTRVRVALLRRKARRADRAKLEP